MARWGTRRTRGIALAAAGLLAGCLSWYEGRGLTPGIATRADVVAVMGQPVASYPDASGEILEYDRGERRFMARLGANGRLENIEQVYTRESFARVRAGMSPGEVNRALGIPYSATRFARRNETVWDYRFRDEVFDYVTYFHVAFDEARGTVKSTFYTREYLPASPVSHGRF